MTPNYNLVADTCPAPFKSVAEDSPSIHARVGGIRQNTRLGWDHEVRRASMQQQDGGVGSHQRGLVAVVDDGDASVEAGWRELVRRQHGDSRDVQGG